MLTVYTRLGTIFTFLILVYAINRTFIVITNLNEEEQESGKKSLGEEKFVNENFIDFSFISIYENSVIGNNNKIGYLDLYLEVFSPPPDYIS